MKSKILVSILAGVMIIPMWQTYQNALNVRLAFYKQNNLQKEMANDIATSMPFIQWLKDNGVIELGRGSGLVQTETVVSTDGNQNVNPCADGCWFDDGLNNDGGVGNDSGKGVPEQPIDLGN